jgi:nucleotide-binding universal stress UspA family protein
MPGIIVGVDGSADSLRALRWAINEAAARHSPLTVLSVRHCRAITYAAGDLGLDQMAGEVQAMVDKAVSSLCGPVPPVTIRVIPGSPATELTHAARGADLLVMGSSGSGGIGRLTLGSVTSQVAYDAPCPVVIIPSR